MLGSNSGVGVALSRGTGSLKVWSMLMRRPSFPQSSGDWRGRHNHGKPAPTAASMAEAQYEDDDTDGVPSPTATTPTTPRHAPHCRCYLPVNTLRVPGDPLNVGGATSDNNDNDNNRENKTNNNGGSGGGGGEGGGGGGLLSGGQQQQHQHQQQQPHQQQRTGEGGNMGVVGGTGDGGEPPVCTCYLSHVTLGGVTSPDGSKTSLVTSSSSSPGAGGGGGGGGAVVTTSTTTNNNKKTRRPRGAKPTVIFNVGGQTFETYRSTLKRFKNSFFADDDKMRAYFRPAQGDYFFDRDPHAFGCVLNYLRTGDLHVPTTLCGPALQTELEFWGIDELDIERCCWTQYNTWKTQSRSLEKLEYDRKFSTTQNLDLLRGQSKSCWDRSKAAMWQFLQDPGSSRAAKVYAWVSILFVFVSIFSFCADTHPLFRVQADDVGDFAPVYRFFNLEFVEITSDNNTTSSSSSSSFPSSSSNSYNDSLVLGLGGIDDEDEEEEWDGTGGYNETTLGGEMGMNASSGGLMGMNMPNNNNKDVDDEEGTRGNRTLKDEDLPHPSLLIIDLTCLIFFTLEYMTRFVCAPSQKAFVRSFQNVIDFVAISPDYVELLVLIFDPMRREGLAVMDLMFILRMLRLCRIFRLIRHVPGLWILLYTLKASFNELMLMFVFLLIGMVVFATLMHFAEGQNGFPNIPVGFWWSVVTMTTVGYGDMFPQTAAGYVIGSCCAVAGLLMIAFTVPIIVSNFVLYYTHVQYGLARRDRELEKFEDEEENAPNSNSRGPGDLENQAVNNAVAELAEEAASKAKHRPVVVGGGNGGEKGGGGRGGGGRGGGGDDAELLSSLSKRRPHHKAPIDSQAIALGEDVALTSSVPTVVLPAVKRNSVHFEDETIARTAAAAASAAASAAEEEVILLV